MTVDGVGGVSKSATKVYIVGNNSNINYIVTFVGQEDAYEIIKRDITVAIDNQVVLYGQKEKELTYSVAIGTLAYEDKLIDLVNITREEGSDVGTYDIYGQCLNDNYNILFTKSLFSLKTSDT